MDDARASRTSRAGKLIAAAVLALGLVGVASPATAQDAGADEVALRNGGSVRGTVISSDPGTSVKILEIGQTQPRVIPWAEVLQVQKGKYAAPSGPPSSGYVTPSDGPPAPPPAAPPYVPPLIRNFVLPPAAPHLGTPGVVRLHIDSPVIATVLERRGPFLGDERQVCTAPCDRIIDGNGAVFHLANDFYPSGGPFTLMSMSGDITMHVQPGNGGMRVAGGWLVSLGSLAAIAGAVLLPIAFTNQVNDLNTGMTVTTPSRPLEYAGAALLGGGLAVLGAGITLAVVGNTSFWFEPTQGRVGSRKPRYWMGEF